MAQLAKSRVQTMAAVARELVGFAVGFTGLVFLGMAFVLPCGWYLILVGRVLSPDVAKHIRCGTEYVGFG